MRKSRSVIGVCLTLLLMLNVLASPGPVPHQTWLAVSVDMDHFLEHASFESTTKSELVCASLALKNNADLYCYKPQNCYLTSLTVFKAGKQTDGWTCKGKEKRECVEGGFTFLHESSCTLRLGQGYSSLYIKSRPVCVAPMFFNHFFKMLTPMFFIFMSKPEKIPIVHKYF